MRKIFCKLRQEVVIELNEDAHAQGIFDLEDIENHQHNSEEGECEGELIIIEE